MSNEYVHLIFAASLKSFSTLALAIFFFVCYLSQNDYVPSNDWIIDCESKIDDEKQMTKIVDYMLQSPLHLAHRFLYVKPEWLNDPSEPFGKENRMILQLLIKRPNDESDLERQCRYIRLQQFDIAAEYANDTNPLPSDLWSNYETKLNK